MTGEKLPNFVVGKDLESGKKHDGMLKSLD